MKYVIISLSIAVLSFFIMIYQLQIDFQKKAYAKIDYGLKHAVHDAALQIDEQSLSEGLVIFDGIRVEETFKETLTKNIPVNEDLKPTNFLIQEKINILDTLLIDDAFIDHETGNTVTFPFIYKYENALLGINFDRAIFGPSVIYVIEAKVYGDNEFRQFITIQEYKPRI